MIYRILLVTSLLVLNCQPAEKKNRRTSKNEFQESTEALGWNAQAPFLFMSPQGHLYLSWTETHGDSSVLMFSRRKENSPWSSPLPIASGSNWFVNWADYPVVCTSDDQHLLAHSLRKRAEGTYDYDIWLSQSSDGGKSWEDTGLLHDDGMAAEHGFVSMTPFDNTYFITWLDGRNTRGHDMEGHSGQGAMTLRGAIVAKDGQKKEEWELDDRVCDCCQTSAALTDAGPVVVYRNRSENEIRDIFITRSLNGTWTEPVAVHEDGWKIEGCPVNGPRIVSRENRLAIAWFTGADQSPSVRVAFSEDAGSTFSTPLDLHQTAPVGRVDVLWLSEEEVLVTWMENKQVTGARVHMNGTITERYIFGASDDSRSAGFPQAALLGNSVFIAVTDPDSGRIVVRKMAL